MKDKLQTIDNKAHNRKFNPFSKPYHAYKNLFGRVSSKEFPSQLKELKAKSKVKKLENSSSSTESLPNKPAPVQAKIIPELSPELHWEIIKQMPVKTPKDIHDCFQAMIALGKPKSKEELFRGTRHL